MSATFWNKRRKKRKEQVLNNQKEPEKVMEPKKVKVKKSDDK